MKIWKFFVTSLVVFIVFEVLEYIQHMVILKGAYETLTSVWRPEAEMNSLLWLLYVLSFLFFLVFVYIFSKGYEGKGIMEGVRYGLIIGLVIVLGCLFRHYIYYPLPFDLVLKWVIFGLIEFIIAGIVLAAMYGWVKK